MFNPFSEIVDHADSDNELIANVLQAGDASSLEKLILRQQAWIYNIAFKMVMDHDDASDITQEILIKMISNLSSYNHHKAAFRTWLYRITVNQVLTMKRKKFEHRIKNFGQYIDLIRKLPDHQPANHPEADLLAQEFKVGCMMGMLICLSRKDRLVFLLGAIFELKDTTGAELMDISRENFRKKLSRARQKLFQHMNDVCGHVNSKNPCICTKKYKNFVEMGMIDPNCIRYHKPEARKVKEVIEKRLDQFTDQYYDPFIDLFQEQPFYTSPDMVSWFRDIIKQDKFKGIFNLQ